MSDQRVYLDDIYASKECQGSVFRAVVMMAHEARFLNSQAGQGYIQLTKKPTTIVLLPPNPKTWRKTLPPMPKQPTPLSVCSS